MVASCRWDRVGGQSVTTYSAASCLLVRGGVTVSQCFDGHPTRAHSTPRSPPVGGCIAGPWRRGSKSSAPAQPTCHRGGSRLGVARARTATPQARHRHAMGTPSALSQPRHGHRVAAWQCTPEHGDALRPTPRPPLGVVDLPDGVRTLPDGARGPCQMGPGDPRWGQDPARWGQGTLPDGGPCQMGVPARCGQDPARQARTTLDSFCCIDRSTRKRLEVETIGDLGAVLKESPSFCGRPAGVSLAGAHLPYQLQEVFHVFGPRHDIGVAWAAHAINMYWGRLGRR